MSLSKEAIEEFQQIYKQEFGEEIAEEKADQLGSSLIGLFKIIYRKIPEESGEELKKKEGIDVSSGYIIIQVRTSSNPLRNNLLPEANCHPFRCITTNSIILLWNHYGRYVQGTLLVGGAMIFSTMLRGKMLVSSKVTSLSL